ncbi:MAG: ABC transporter permease subunit [Actinomycetota bacterium]|nr:ABC transporter permease subunit [Actinomycetota bacterium]
MIAQITQLWETHKLGLRTMEHLGMFAIAIGLSIGIGVMIGILIYSNKKVSNTVFNALNIIQIIPTLALLILLLPLLGLGKLPTIAACVLYSILPIARNTYAGLANIDQDYIETGKAIGLNRKDILFRIRIPLALPLIAGDKNSHSVYHWVITLGGLIAAGGLGAPLQTGIHLYDKPLILLTGIWVGLLALALDGIGALAEKLLKKRYSYGNA